MSKEDWSSVTDRSQKKRMQNRVAQRTYRNRIKQRVEELEKEVNEYRRRAQEQQTTSDESHNGSETGAPNANGSTSNTPDNSPGHIGGDAMTRCSSNSPGSVNGKGTPSSNSNEDMSKDNINKDKSCNGGGSSNSSISGSSNYAIEMDTDGDSRLNGAASHASPVSATLLPHSNPVIQPQCLTQAPRPQQMAPQLTFAPFPGMTSPPLPQPYALAPDWPWTGAPGGIYRDAMGQQPLTGFSAMGGRQVGGDGYDTGSDASFHISPEAAYMIHPDHEHHSMAPPEGVMEMSMGGGHTSRSSDAGSSEVGSPGSSASSICVTPLLRGDNNNINITNNNNNDKNWNKAMEMQVRSEQPLRERSLEERFEFMRTCAAAAGFGNFDTMIRQYYTADFNCESIVSREQRQSRHSQLPVLLNKLRKDVKSWTQWEAHGYQAETIKSAETVIRTERSDFSVPQPLYVEVLSELEKISRMTEGVDNAAMSRAFQPMTRMFQDTQPKLWALTESLVGSDDTMNPRQRTYTALAIMLLLCGSDQLPKAQMTALVTNCLQIVQSSPR